MKFFKDRDVINVFKFSILFLLVAIGMFLIPNIAYTVRDGNYIKNDIVPLEKENFDSYLEKIASYYQFYYDKEPVIDRMIIEENDIYFEFSVYAVSYYQKNNIGDSLQFFIHEAKVGNKNFKELQANILYEKPIKENKPPKKDIIYLDTNTIRNNSFVKSFFAANLKVNENDKDLNNFKAIEINVILEGSKNEVPFFVFTDDSDIKDKFPAATSITNNNLTTDRYSISNNISDKSSNIPTSLELEENGYFYEVFNMDSLKPYNWLLWLIIGSYILFLLLVMYFMFLHSAVKEYLKNKKTS